MSTRVGDVEVGHGQNVVVLQLIRNSGSHLIYGSTTLTASQAERLAVYLMRQASAARQVNWEARADAVFAPALAAHKRTAGDGIQQRQEEQA